MQCCQCLLNVSSVPGQIVLKNVCTTFLGTTTCRVPGLCLQQSCSDLIMSRLFQVKASTNDFLKANKVDWLCEVCLCYVHIQLYGTQPQVWHWRSTSRMIARSAPVQANMLDSVFTWTVSLTWAVNIACWKSEHQHLGLASVFLSRHWHILVFEHVSNCFLVLVKASLEMRAAC